MIKVPLQCHQSAIKSAVEIRHYPRSNGISAISAVENRKPAPCARCSSHMQKQALTALTALPTTLTSENTNAINGTATALPPGGSR
jgi:hypothetical protein